MSLHTSVYNSIVTEIASGLLVYLLERVSQTTQDLITPTLPLTTSTTRVGGGQIASPTARLSQSDREYRDTSCELTAIPFRGDS